MDKKELEELEARRDEAKEKYEKVAAEEAQTNEVRNKTEDLVLKAKDVLETAEESHDISWKVWHKYNKRMNEAREDWNEAREDWNEAREERAKADLKKEAVNDEHNN